jgi:hypothetical protein
MKFDLPRDTESFLSHPNWDFRLSHESSDFEVSLQEVEGILEEDELPFLKTTVVQVVGKKGEAIRMAVEKYFEEFNQKWNRGEPISREEFMARLRMSSISIESDRSAALELEDDHDMFWGHAIVVRLNPEGKIRELELAG